MFLLTWCSLFLCNNLTMHCTRTGSLELLMLVLLNNIETFWKRPCAVLFSECQVEFGVTSLIIHEEITIEIITCEEHCKSDTKSSSFA